MSEGFTATYAKAIDDISGKIFTPGLIASLMVEFSPWYQGYKETGLFETYIVCVATGVFVSIAIFWLIAISSTYLFSGEDIAPIVAITIMPLGFAGLFPDQFENFSVPYSQVTGVAILAWSFMLLSKKTDNKNA